MVALVYGHGMTTTNPATTITATGNGRLDITDGSEDRLTLMPATDARRILVLTDTRRGHAVAVALDPAARRVLAAELLRDIDARPTRRKVPRTPKPRIDTLTPGTEVTLDFAGRYAEDVTFLGIDGEGDDRRARFRSYDNDQARYYEWEAYRYEGRWAFGIGAGTLRLVSVESTPAKEQQP